MRWNVSNVDRMGVYVTTIGWDVRNDSSKCLRGCVRRGVSEGLKMLRDVLVGVLVRMLLPVLRGVATTGAVNPLLPAGTVIIVFPPDPVAITPPLIPDPVVITLPEPIVDPAGIVPTTMVPLGEVDVVVAGSGGSISGNRH